MVMKDTVLYVIFFCVVYSALLLTCFLLIHGDNDRKMEIKIDSLSAQIDSLMHVQKVDTTK